MIIAPATFQSNVDLHQFLLESLDSNPAIISEETLKEDIGYKIKNENFTLRFIEQQISPYFNELDKLKGVPEYDSNGEEGIAITKETVEQAKLFLKKLCEENLEENLELFPDTDGQIEFEWLKTNNHFVSICVDSEGYLYWAARINGEPFHRKDDLSKNLPDDLKGFIRKIM